MLAKQKPAQEREVVTPSANAERYSAEEEVLDSTPEKLAAPLVALPTGSAQARAEVQKYSIAEDAAMTVASKVELTEALASNEGPSDVEMPAAAPLESLDTFLAECARGIAMSPIKALETILPQPLPQVAPPEEEEQPGGLPVEQLESGFPMPAEQLHTLPEEDPEAEESTQPQEEQQAELKKEQPLAQAQQVAPEVDGGAAEAVAALARAMEQHPGAAQRVDDPLTRFIGDSMAAMSSSRKMQPPKVVKGGAETEAEAWTSFVSRSELVVGAAELLDDAATLFEAFRVTDDIGLAFATFALLSRHAEAAVSSGKIEGGSRYPYKALSGLVTGTWKARALWRLLDDRTGRPEYLASPCKGQRFIVLGAGPCGLRAGIELRMLGAEVTCVDSRMDFTRINQLHLWAWCGEDLKALGARIIEPPTSSFGANPDLLHISISDLQKLLMKVCLLLGVTVHLGTDYIGSEWNSTEGSWQARLSKAASVTRGHAGEGGTGGTMSFGNMTPSPAAPSVICQISAVVVANGFGSRVGQTHGLQVVETESLRRESAIGLICNFKRSNGTEERKLRSFSMAKQFYLNLFSEIAEETGAELENMVYTKGLSSHYFVMTPTHRCLAEAGIIIDKMAKPMLSRENIDFAKLDEIVRKITAFEFKADEPAVLAAAADDLGHPGGFKAVEYADGGPRLFDFSRMRRHVEGLTFVRPGISRTSANDEGPSMPDDLLVAVVGDALIEPFWPEGLGIVRGFFSVLDASSAIAAWSDGADKGATRRHFESAFQQLKTLGAATRANVLKENEATYALDPASRYKQLSIGGAKF